MAIDNAGYESKRRSVNTQYSANLAANDYGRHVAQQRGSRQVGQFQRDYQSGWGKTATSWGQRGHTGGNVRSGFYQKAMQDYLGNSQRSRNELLQGQANEKHAFGVEASRIQQARDQALAELEMQKQRDIALLAQNIQAIRPSIY